MTRAALVCHVRTVSGGVRHRPLPRLINTMRSQTPRSSATNGTTSTSSGPIKSMRTPDSRAVADDR